MWLTEAGIPTTACGIAGEHLEAFLAALADWVFPRDRVAKRDRSLQQLFPCLVEDGEIPRSPMERMRPPAVPEQPVDIFTDDQLRALLDICRGQHLREPPAHGDFADADRDRDARRGAGGLSVEDLDASRTWTPSSRCPS